ncbi:MAG: cytochrome C oxidase subunit IV family protein [Chitinophagales bacterium]|nr:cytochrome C oxidase subunit IV family protein [Chitinophagales bacterium]
MEAEAQYRSQVKAVWRATIIIGIVTVFEVSLALSHFFFFYEHPKLVINVFMTLATLLKAFYIIAEFMHLQYEKRTLIITLGLPLVFLTWLIVVMLVEGKFAFSLLH